MKTLWRKLLTLLGLYNLFKSIETGPITVTEAISIVEAAPEDKWTTHKTLNYMGQSCFMGHLAIAKGYPAENTTAVHKIPELGKFSDAVAEFVEKKHNKKIWHAFEINDAPVINGYTEDHPKDRMLHILNDMKEAGIK